jgi:hypothetical protein
MRRMTLPGSGQSVAIKTKHNDFVRNDPVVIGFDSRLDIIANNTWHARCYCH